MLRLSPTRRKREERQRGAVAVEFALMASLLIVMFFGSLEFGLMLRSRTNLTSASREAVRTAAAQPREDGFQNSALAVVNGASRNVGQEASCTSRSIGPTPTTTGVQSLGRASKAVSPIAGVSNGSMESGFNKNSAPAGTRLTKGHVATT